jgi:hypothetical protein
MDETVLLEGSGNSYSTMPPVSEFAADAKIHLWPIEVLH